jgi:hypothetical protein
LGWAPLTYDRGLLTTVPLMFGGVAVADAFTRSRREQAEARDREQARLVAEALEENRGE